MRNKARVKRMSQLMNSIAAQVHPLTAFMASISSETKKLMKGARNVFEKLEEDVSKQGMIVHVTYQTTRLTQFEHYASLMEPVRKLAHSLKSPGGQKTKGESNGATMYHDDKENSNIWLLFTDDDDLWHPFRILVYSQAINTTLKQHGMTALAIPVNAQNSGIGADFEKPKDVDEMLRNQAGQIVQYTVKMALEKAILLQYWTHAVPFRIMLDFLLVTPPEALNHESCDYRFSFMMRGHLKKKTNLLESGLLSVFWLYFHRQHNEGRVSTGIWAAAKVKPEDIELATKVQGKLTQSYDGHWAAEKEHTEGRPENEDPVVRICAELRRSVERHLTVYGALLPLSTVVEGTLQQQRLQDTADKAGWAELIEQMISAKYPTLVLPNRPGPGDGFLGRGSYQQLLLDEQFWQDLWVRYFGEGNAHKAMSFYEGSKGSM